METLPSNPTRYKLALTFWVLFSLVFVGVLLYRTFIGPRHMLWLGFSGLLSLIGIWRVILAARRSRDQNSAQATV